MGITVSYRGRIAEFDRIEDFEDRVLDLVLDLGGTAQIWRSSADHDPKRMVRGVLAHIDPGQETTSLLIAPEGWLVGLIEIEDAERGVHKEPPWCFVKTQFGPVEAHVALIEMLTALKQEFFPDLEVHDEGGYWETRDLAELTRRHSFLKAAIDGMAEGLQQYGLSAEAAEDPEILVERIKRIAAKVHATLRRPSEHPPAIMPGDDDESAWPPDPDKVEAEWDAIFLEQRRKQERLTRAIEERQHAGEEIDEAFENSLRDIGTPVPGDEMLPLGGEEEGEEDDEPAWKDDLLAALDDADGDDGDDAEAWKESAEDDEPDPGTGERPDPIDKFDRRTHPLVRRAMDLMLRLREIVDRGEGKPPNPAEFALFHGAGDVMGGLSQAMCERGDDEDEENEPDALGLPIVQLKRALRGAAFARGAVFQLRDTIPQPERKELHDTLVGLQKDMFEELGRLRAALRPGGHSD